ncbi:MAG: hypothetical protein EPO22_10390 [Dehalococcoidia bacterium]|nr:MAG: hypothetical protein EPO22_10390 [Dehalococcoidia bacterium]
MLRRSPFAALALIVLAALAFAACRSSSTSDPTPTTGHNTAPSSVSTATPGATPTPSQAIRMLDLKNSPPVQKVIAESGGQFVQSEVIYADLTDDGQEDAVVPISSGGTLGDIAFVVLGATGGNTRTLVSEYPKDGRGLAVVVFGDKLVVTEAVPGPDDPECCPSQLRKTIYGWNGVTLAIESVSTEPNPDAGPKATPGGATTP